MTTIKDKDNDKETPPGTNTSWGQVHFPGPDAGTGSTCSQPLTFNFFLFSNLARVTMDQSSRTRKYIVRLCTYGKNENGGTVHRIHSKLISFQPRN